MTIEEIQTAVDELANALGEKGETANVSYEMNSHKWADLWLKLKDGYEVFHGATPAKAIEKARAYIAALPSPEEAVTREYLGKVASAIDYATKHSIADEYVTPLRGVTMAMTDNLLTKEPNT